MKKLLLKLIGYVLCLCMAASLLPQTAVFAEETEIQYISQVLINGLNKPVAGEPVPACNLTIKNLPGDIATVKCEGWYRSADDTYICRYNAAEGTKYNYGFYLRTYGENRLAPDCEISIYDSDEREYIPIPTGNLTYKSTYWEPSLKKQVYCYSVRTGDYLTEGTERKFLNEVVIEGVNQPIYGGDISKYIKSIKLPDGVPYTITGTFLGAKNENDRYSPPTSTTFSESEEYLLYIFLKFPDSCFVLNNTKIKLVNGGGSPFEAHISCDQDAYRNEATVVLYYKLKMPESHTITFDANGGVFYSFNTTSSPATTRTDGTLWGMPNALKRDGYAFGGWYTEREGGELLSGDEVYYSDTTVYAHWIEAVKEVRLDNVVMPIPGRAPVINSKPIGTDFEVEYECWSCTKADGKYYYTSIPEYNEYLKENGMLITEFESGVCYDYGVTFTASEDKPFGYDTAFYINGEEQDCYYPIWADSMTIFMSVFPKSKEFIVYNEKPVEIPTGLTNTKIKDIDLKSYICAPEGFTIEAPPDFPFSVSDSGVITGTRGSTAEAEKTYTFTVSSGGESVPLYVTVGAVKDAPFISVQPKSINENCYDIDEEQPAIFKVKAEVPDGAEVTYTWYWYYKDGNVWMSMIQLKSMGFDHFTGEDTDMLIMNTVDNGDRVYCQVTVNGTTIHSSEASAVVKHNGDDCSPLETTDSDYHTKHNVTCSDCGANLSTAQHTFKYRLWEEATEEKDGKYWKYCTGCKYGYGVYHSYSYSDMTNGESVNIVLNPNGGTLDGSTSPKPVNQKQYTSKVPYHHYPLRTGYAFAGWAVKQDAKTPDFYPDSEVFCPDTVGMTLYAVWTKADVLVCGKSINEGNQNDVLGDGTVRYTPQTALSYAKLTLENADLFSWPIYGENVDYGIFSTQSLCIELIGDNVIDMGAAIAYGILTSGNLTIEGTGTLRIKGTGDLTYGTAITGHNIECSAESIYISDCGKAFSGIVNIYGCTTEIYSGNSNDLGFIPSDSSVNIGEYHPAKIFCSASKDTPAGKISAKDLGYYNVQYILIVPESSEPYIHYNTDRKSVFPIGYDSGTVYIADYDEDGRLIHSAHNSFTEEGEFLARGMDMTAGSKIMLWDNESILKPLCNAVLID